jgi:MarR family transcriptional regulator, organic hydroperoxide resistance regulator
MSRPHRSPAKPRPRRRAGSARPARGEFAPPPTVSHAALLVSGSDVAFRETLYLMVLAFGRLITCREAFGRALGLTGSQFAVLFGTAYRQGREGVSIRRLAEHVQLASTHVTTEVGRLVRKGLLVKTTNQHDRRGVLVKLSHQGEAAVQKVAPFLRRVNDHLFQGVSRRDVASLDRFLRVFARNGEDAVTEIRRTEEERPVQSAKAT